MLKSKLSRKLLTSASLFALFSNTQQTLAGSDSDVYINNNVTKTYTTSYSQQSGHLYIGDPTTGGTLIFATPTTVSSSSSSISIPIINNTTLSLTLGSGNLNFAGPDASTNQGLFKLDSTNGPLILNIALSNNSNISSSLVANRGTFEFNANGYNATLNTGNVAVGSATSPIHAVQTEGSGNVAFNAPLFARGINANGPNTQNVTYSQNVNIVSNPTAVRDGIVMINGTGTNNFQGNLITQAVNQNLPGVLYFVSDGIVNMSAGTTLTSNIISTDGNEGTVAFLGTGTWNGSTIFSPGTGNNQTPAIPTINVGFKKLLVGAGNFSLGASTYNINEISGNGTNTLTLADGFNLIGGFNLSGGQAINLSFPGSGNISSSIGTAAPVTGSTAIDNGISLTNTNPIGNLRLGTGNLIINGGLAASGITYTASPANLTVTGPISLGASGITTAGNSDVLAVACSFYTGTGTIGTSASPLLVKLLNNNTIYVNTKNFNANITTANNNQGIVNLNVANGVVTGSIGDTTNALGVVNFNASETITGQTFANRINVAQGQNAQFNSNINYNPANTNIYGSMVLANNANAIFTGRGSYIRIPILSSAAGTGNGTITIADNTTGVRFQGPIGGSVVGNTPANTLAISNITVGKNSELIPDSTVVLRNNNSAAIALANGASLVVDPAILANPDVVRTIIGVYGTEYISAAGGNAVRVINGGQLKLQGITIGQAASNDKAAAPVQSIVLQGSLATNRDINASSTQISTNGNGFNATLQLNGDGTSVGSAINVNSNIAMNATSIPNITPNIILNTSANTAYNFNGTLALNGTNGTASDNIGNFTVNTGSFSSIVSSPNNNMNIGVNPAQRLSQFNTTGSGNITVNPNVYATNINSNGTGSVTYNGIVNSGAGGSLVYSAAGITNFNAGATISLINFNNYNSTINIAANQALTSNITSSNGLGIVSLAQNANWIGTTAGAGFGQLLVAGGSVLQAGTYNIGEVKGTSTGNLGLADGFILNGGINTSSGSALNLSFAGNAIVNGNIGSGSSVGTIYMTGYSGATVLLNGSVTAQGIIYARQNETLQIAGNLNSPVQFNGSSNVLALSGSNTTVNGDISGSGGVVRILPNVTNVTFNSLIGDLAAITLLDLQTGSSANLNANASLDGSAVSSNSDSGNGSNVVGISGINIGNGATLNLAAGKNISAINSASIIFNNLTSTLNVVGNASTTISAPITLNGNSGMIIANGISSGNNLTINGDIGNSNNYLNILQARGGGSVILNGNSYITTLDIVGNNSIVELGGNSTYLFTNFLHNNNQGQLVVDQNAIIASLSNISTATDRISGITLKNGSSLALGDGVNIYTSSNGINGGGDLILLGNAIIDASIGNSSKIGDINIKGTNNKVIFYQDINNGKINIINDNLVQFAGNITASGIVANTKNTTIEFINKDRAIVKANVGVNNPINTFRITNASVNVYGSFAANNIDFNNPNVVSALYSLGGSDLGSTNVTTNSDIRAHNIHVNGNQHITGSIGSANNLFGSITLENDSTITVDTTNFYAAVRSVKDGEGTVIFTKDGSRGYQLGRSVDALDTANLPSNSLKAIIFNGNTTSYGVARATNIYIAADKTATFNSGFNLPGENTVGGQAISGAVISSGGVHLQGADSNIIIGDGTLLEAAVYTDVKNTGNIIFNGGSKTFNNIGTVDVKLSSIIFNQSSAGNAIKIDGTNANRNFNADNIVSNAATIQLYRDLTINGSFTVNNGTNIDLGSHRLILSSGNSVFNGNINLNTSVGAGSFGHIDVSGSSTVLDLSKANAVNVVVNATTLPTSFSDLLFLETNGGKITTAANDNINVTSDNKFLVTAYDPNNRMLTIGSASNTTISQDIQTIINKAGLSNSNAAAIGTALVNNLDDPVVKELIFGFGSMTDEVVAESLLRLESSNSAQANINLVNTNNIYNRIQAIDNSASSSGDNIIEYGLWVSPLYSNTRQDKTSRLMGYKTRTNGISVGLDANTDQENTILGAVYTYAHTDAKLRGMKIGDKSKNNSSIFSVYGSHKFYHNWFVQSIASVGFGKVHNSETRILSNTDTRLAKSKYSITNYDFQADLGYNYRMTRGFSMTPILGAHYFNSPKVRYNENGAGVQNLSVHYKAQNNLELKTGGKLDLKYNVGQGYLTPEIYAFVNYNVNNKRPLADIKLLGTNFNLPILQEKAKRVWFNLGTNVNFNKGIMEYSFNLDVEFKKKYTAQQSSLTIKAKL